MSLTYQPRRPKTKGYIIVVGKLLLRFVLVSGSWQDEHIQREFFVNAACQVTKRLGKRKYV